MKKYVHNKQHLSLFIFCFITSVCSSIIAMDSTDELKKKCAEQFQQEKEKIDTIVSQQKLSDDKKTNYISLHFYIMRNNLLQLAKR